MECFLQVSSSSEHTILVALKNLWPGTRGTWMQLMGSLSALVPVVVRLTHSPPSLGAASAARVYRVLAAVVSSLRERIRSFTYLLKPRAPMTSERMDLLVCIKIVIDVYKLHSQVTNTCQMATLTFHKR